MVKKYSELYLDARKALLDYDGENAAFMARQLLSFASGKRFEEILRDRELYASEEIEQTLMQCVARHVRGEPLAYILGQWEFAGMRLAITPEVLIPRDDTMAVTELAIKKTLFLDENPRVLDLCAGSGCIGIAVARRVKDARVTLAELSEAALKLAKKNVQLQNLTGRVTCVQADATKPASPFLGQFDLIVSNPPYIPASQMQTLEPSVREYEPHMALLGGADGLDFYRAIVQNFRAALKPHGYLCFEFGLGQCDAVCRILEHADFEMIQTAKDANGILRAVIARDKREETEYGTEETGL
ncbi:MAG: peptide chain release factor N(5)-glutamine methyltransferase [Oscillospiraceae bacterium]|nr:peptide chain release factor N(5)-glutamine methyltransferase [Oscillospiraceae bacterium]